MYVYFPIYVYTTNVYGLLCMYDFLYVSILHVSILKTHQQASAPTIRRAHTHV